MNSVSVLEHFISRKGSRTGEGNKVKYEGYIFVVSGGKICS